MVGIPYKRDYDKEVYDLIYQSGRSKSISRMATILKMRNENVISSLKNLQNRTLLQKHDDESYPYYTTLEDSADSYLRHIEQSTEFYHKQIDEKIKQLSKKKIFINVKITKLKELNSIKDPKTGKTIKLKPLKDPKAISYKINPKIVNLYKGFISNLNLLQNLASKIRLLQILKVIPKTKFYNEKCETLEHKIYDLIKSSLEDLEREHELQSELLVNDLKWKLPILKI